MTEGSHFQNSNHHHDQHLMIESVEVCTYKLVLVYHTSSTYTVVPNYHRGEISVFGKFNLVKSIVIDSTVKLLSMSYWREG
jgi:hypothetical protein